MRLITTLFILALLAGGFALLYVYSGAYNVAATAPHSAFENWLYDTVMQKSVRARARRIETPPLEDPGMIANGGRMYGATCETCHGGPGIKPTDLAQGLRPRAPDLARASQNWKPNELFWIVQNGVSRTGMPAWGATHEDEELWSVVAFVTRLPDMRYEDYWRLTRGEGEHPAISDTTGARPPAEASPAAGAAKEAPIAANDAAQAPGGRPAEAPRADAQPEATPEPRPAPEADPAAAATGTQSAAREPAAEAAERNRGGGAAPSETGAPARSNAQEAERSALRVQARPQPKPDVPDRLAPRRRR